MTIRPLAALVALLLASVAAAQCDFDRLGRFERTQFARAIEVAVKSPYAFLFTSSDSHDAFGLVAFDISDPDAPVEIQQTPIDARVQQRVFVNDLLWVIGDDDRAHVYRTTAAQPLNEIASYNMTGTPMASASGWVAAGPRVYMTTATGLAVYTLSNPNASPVLAGSFTVGYPIDKIVVDQARGLLFGVGNGGLNVLDISNPAQIALLGVHPQINGFLFHVDGTSLYAFGPIPSTHMVVRRWNMTQPLTPVMADEWVSPESDAEAYLNSAVIWGGKIAMRYSIGYYENWDGEWLWHGQSYTRTIDQATLNTLGDPGSFYVRGNDGPIAYMYSNSTAQLFDFTDMLDPRPSGTLQFSGQPDWLAFAGGLIYGYDKETATLLLLDAGKPDLETLIATLPVPLEPLAVNTTPTVRGVSAHGSHLILPVHSYADDQWYYDYQLYRVVDRSRVEFVRNLGWPSTPTYSYPLVPEVEGDRGFWVDDGTVTLIDWSDPSDPRLASVYTPPSGIARRATIMQGKPILLVTTATALHLVDITDPAAPVLLSTLTGPYMMEITDLAANTDHAFGVSGATGQAFHTFDLSDPTHPVHVAVVPRTTPGFYYQGVVMFGELGVFNKTPNSRSFHEASDLSAPTMLQRESNGPIRHMAIDRGILYGYGSTNGGTDIRSFDLQGGTVLAPHATTGSPESAFGVTAWGDYAILCEYGTGVRIFDVSSANEPLPVGAFNTPDRAYQAAVAGNTMFVADGASGLLALDLSNPAAPTLVGSQATSDLAIAVHVEGDFAYVALRFDGLAIIDISNPAAMTVVGTVDTPGNAQGVAVDGHIVYVADGTEGVQVVDTSNRSSPSIIGSYDTPQSARQVLVQGATAYVPDRAGGLLALDISDPTDPRLISTAGPMTDARSVAGWGHLLFVADFDGRVHMIDAADISDMHIIQTLPSFGTGRAITSDGRMLYLADGDAGLTVLEAQPCWYRPCPADLNDDGLLDFFDLQVYLNAYSATSGVADWNNDGLIDFFDLLGYISSFSDGCP